MPPSVPLTRPNPFGFLPVWQRNFLVWRKLALPSILGNLADPLIYMLGLGYGLGAMLPSIEGQPYVAFLAAGTVCASMARSQPASNCRLRCRWKKVASISGWAMTCICVAACAPMAP